MAKRELVIAALAAAVVAAPTAKATASQGFYVGAHFGLQVTKAKDTVKSKEAKIEGQAKKQGAQNSAGSNAAAASAEDIQEWMNVKPVGTITLTEGAQEALNSAVTDWVRSVVDLDSLKASKGVALDDMPLTQFLDKVIESERKLPVDDNRTQEEVDQNITLLSELKEKFEAWQQSITAWSKALGNNEDGRVTLEGKDRGLMINIAWDYDNAEDDDQKIGLTRLVVYLPIDSGDKCDFSFMSAAPEDLVRQAGWKFGNGDVVGTEKNHDPIKAYKIADLLDGDGVNVELNMLGANALENLNLKRSILAQTLAVMGANNPSTGTSSTSSSNEVKTELVPFSSDIPVSTSKVSKTKSGAVFGLDFGYFFTSETFYGAVGAGAEFVSGKNTIKTGDTQERKEHDLGDVKLAFENPVRGFGSDLTLKTKYRFYVNADFGITANNWMLYLRLQPNVTKYNFKITPSPILDSIDTASATYQGNGIDGDVNIVNDGKAVEKDKVSSTPYKKNKTKAGFGAGLGVKVMLTPAMWIDMGYLYGFKQTVKLTYMGNEHKVDITSHKFTLGLGYNF